MKNPAILLNYWMTLIVTLVILHLSFAPPSEFSKIPTFENEDKLVHFLMYFGLITFTIYDTYRLNLKRSLNKISCIKFSIFFSIALGGVIEIMQPLFFAPRTASWMDWLADCLGVLAGYIFMKWIARKLNKDFFEKQTTNR